MDSYGKSADVVCWLLENLTICYVTIYFLILYISLYYILFGIIHAEKERCHPLGGGALRGAGPCLPASVSLLTSPPQQPCHPPSQLLCRPARKPAPQPPCRLACQPGYLRFPISLHASLPKCLPLPFHTLIARVTIETNRIG